MGKWKGRVFPGGLESAEEAESAERIWRSVASAGHGVRRREFTAETQRRRGKQDKGKRVYGYVERARLPRALESAEMAESAEKVIF